MEIKDLKIIEGKTIKKIEQPDAVTIDSYESMDDNIVIEFTDGSILTLASWDYEGYSSGISKRFITPTNT